MHIKEIILDGFKSYPNRTVVSGFDPAFNAITGLNGSGKSNILDSICFVLGITNLSQVRVGNLHELVYKQGQAGVTKASVTIVFDNSDERTSPVGYEKHKEITICRQVVINGKNKYFINGSVAQQEQVKTLFHSVQLNVNNPHFLIMQGRITKVLNMNAKEILSTIEEAAGTRMFETKKQSALKTMEKKEAKNNEIDRVLNDEITPTLDKLRMEKANYLAYNGNATKIERLERFCTAYQYKEARSTLAESDKKLQEMKESIEAKADQAREKADAIKEKEAAMEAMAQKRGGHMSESYNATKATEEKVSKELVKLTAVWQNKSDSLKAERKALDEAKGAIGKGQKALEGKKEEIAAVEAEYAAATADVDAKMAKLATTEHAFQNMCAGVDEDNAENDSGDSSMTLEGQVTKANEAAAQADEAVKQGEMTAKHLTSTVKDLTKEHAAAGKESQALSNELAAAEKECAKIEGKLEVAGASGKAAFDPKEQKALSAEKVSLEQQRVHTKQAIERLEAELQGRLAFEYKAPHKNFDKRSVKGLVAKLVEVRDSAACTALEVVAGGKLYQVVVDDEQTAKSLLQKGGLRRRVTIIPLNKISRGGLIDDKKAATASKVAKGATGGSATRAIEFVGFQADVQAAMEYAFGDKFVCDSLATARATANHKDVQRKCVTMDGDVVDPSGTMTGGSSGSLGTSLAKLTQLSEAQKELGATEERLRWVAKELTSMEKGASKFAELTEALDLKTQEVTLLKERLSRTAMGAVEARLAEAKAELEAALAKAQEAKAGGKQARAKLAALKKEEGKVRQAREVRLKAMEGDVKKAKKAVKDAEAKAKALEKKLKLVRMEGAKLAEEAESADGSVGALEEEIAALQVAVDEAEAAAAGKRADYDDAKALADAKKGELAACDAEVKQLAKERDRDQKALTAAELEAKKMEGKVGRFNKDLEAARGFCNELQAKHAWIASEEKLFGEPNTDYDFEARDPRAAQRELKDLTKEQEALSKKINKKVMNMLDKAEQEYTELVNKRKTVESDKVKIQKVIAELDVKKNQALQTTWVKVNRDFGSIFSMLLPGTHAKLEPPEDGDGSVLSGLEVKVAFGGVWKESLTELSGGQRSLLALSLILALLLFKPAPMYILDEVDAALDLSHTQNIGAMLRTHFRNSQFIVVSLKEGMFNNANVIFRTKFVDGSSTVSRTVNTTAVAAAFAKDEARAKATKAKTGKKGGASLLALPASDENDAEKGSTGRKGPAKKRGKSAANSEAQIEVEA